MTATATQDAWVSRVLGVALAEDGHATAMATWTTRRETALTALRQVAGEIAAAKHPSSLKAVVEIQSVIKNLTAEPTTPQQVAELQAYLTTDQVVIDVCDLADDFRTPLLGALDELERASVG